MDVIFVKYDSYSMLYQTFIVTFMANGIYEKCPVALLEFRFNSHQGVPRENAAAVSVIGWVQHSCRVSYKNIHARDDTGNSEIVQVKTEVHIHVLLDVRYFIGLESFYGSPWQCSYYIEV